MDSINDKISKTDIINEKIVTNVNELEDNEKTKNDTPSSLPGIIFFLVITTIFTLVTYLIMPNTISEGGATSNLLYLSIYILLLVIGNYFINLNITKSVCKGQPQWANTMFNTLIPWILVFGVINIVLIMFPGWLSPFANTFGFSLINILGLGELLKIILNLNRDNLNIESSAADKLVARGIQEIYGNNSLFINQIPSDPDKFKEFVQTLIDTKYFIKLSIKSPEIIQLFKFIQLKNLIGKYIWNLLTGILVVSISYNFIINSECSNSLKQMQDRRNDFIISENKKQYNKTNERTYYPFIIGNDNDINVKNSSYSTTDNTNNN